MKDKFFGVIFIIVFIVIWEVVARIGIVNPIFISYPSQVSLAFFQFFKDGSVLPHLVTSLTELFVGFFWGAILGITFGLLLGWYKLLDRLFSVSMTVLYITPIIVFLPLFIVWFGLSLVSKVIVVALLTFFPVLISTQTGVKSVDRNLIMVAKSFGAGDFQILRTIVFPSTIPFIISGIRLGIGRALIGVIVAEFYGSNGGLGYLLSLYGGTFQIDRYMAVILIIVVVGLGLTQTVSYFEKKRNL